MKIESSKNKKLWVSSYFTEIFGNKDIKQAKKVLPYKTLEKNMTDEEIKTELGVQECTLADVAAFLKSPPKGCDDGYANLFYVAGFVVLVRWGTDCGRWHVDAYRLDDGYWGAGARAFSRNFSLSPSATELGDLKSLTLRIEKIEQVLKHHNLLPK